MRPGLISLGLLCLTGCLELSAGSPAFAPPGLALPGFAGTSPALALPPGSSSVAMGAIAGLPDDTALGLRRAMVDAFQDQEMPAALDSANRASTRLTGLARLLPLSATEEDLAIRWEMHLPGQPVSWYADQHEPIPAGQPPTSPHLADIARRAVGALLPALRPGAPVERALPSVAVWPIEGAPGDGETSLRRAMERLLLMHGRTIGKSDDHGALALLCEISVTPAPGGKEAVAIRWGLLGADGREIGLVAQDNLIPAGALSGHWGDIADAIAEAAWEGLAPLLERALVSSRHRS